MFRSLFRAPTRGRGYPGPRPSRRFTPSLELLDDRIVPAVISSFSGGVLSITEDVANPGADNVTVVTTPTGDIQVNFFTFGANVTNTTKISVASGRYNDTVDLSGLTGFTGAVTIDGGAGNDMLIGSPGNDTLIDNSGVDSFVGGLGTDTLVGADTANTFNVTFQNAGTLNGQSFSEVENLTGNRNSDTFDLGGFGLIGGVIDGRGGVDTLSYASRFSIVSVNLTTGAATSVNGGVAQIENVTGGQFIDILVGNDADNVLIGNGGIDTLDGGGGNDTLDGGDDN